VIWSNVLQIHDVSLAPRAELAELSTIGTRFAGQGPALMTEYNVYGARHFLRQLDPESAGEFRWRVIPLLSGQGLDKFASADIDEFQTDAVLVYRTLVLRRSATASRPPSAYQLVWQGHHYEVWQRPPVSPKQIIEHLPLGTATDPAAVPNCDEVRRLAKLAGPKGRLVTVARTPTQVLDLSSAELPTGWDAYTEPPDSVLPNGAGTIRMIANITTPGRYHFFLGGTGFRDRLDITVDGKQIYTGRSGWTWPGLYTPVGTTPLTNGRHHVELHYHGPSLAPGSGGDQFYMGPLVLGLDTTPNRTESLTAANATTLCRRQLDWIEAIRP
jgi:hypothetical protein